MAQPSALPSIEGRGSNLIARLGAWVDRHFRRFMIFYLVMLLIAAACSKGWNQADEHARTLEAAHQLVYGYATLPWEFDAARPMVSFLMGVLHTPSLMLGKVMEASGMTEAAMLRAWSGIFNVTRLIPFFLILGLLGFRGTVRGVMTLLYALAPITPVLMVRTSQENWSSTALLWGCWLLMRALPASVQPADGDPANGRMEPAATAAHDSPDSQWRPLLAAGIFFGLAAAFRFQTGVATASAWFWIAWRSGLRRAPALLLPFTAGIAFGLLPLAITDWIMVGKPFLPAWNYLHYALGDEEGGQVWGTDPWYYYLEGFFTAFHPPVSLLAGPLLLIGCRWWSLGGALLIPFALVHFALGHKELRYFFPVLPILYLGVFAAYRHVASAWMARSWIRGASRALPAYAIAKGALAIGLTLVPLHPAPAMYQALNTFESRGKLPDEFTYVANSRSTVAYFYFKHPTKKPVRMEIAPFLAHLRERSLSPGVYAIYRMDIEDYSQVTATCTPMFESLSPRWRRAMFIARALLRKRDVDAIVSCPSTGIAGSGTGGGTPQP